MGCGCAGPRPPTWAKERGAKVPKRVVLESPWAGWGSTALAYAEDCLRDSLLRGEAPYASHWLYAAGPLDDDQPAERVLGLAAGEAWRPLAEAVAVYTDLGVSPGMRQGIAASEKLGQPVEYRRLGGQWHGLAAK